jgi:UMF1 family MFS transporter
MAKPDKSVMTTARTINRNTAANAWIAFDFINSILIINDIKKVSSFWYGLGFTISTILLFFITPFFGSQIDKRRNGRSILFYTSITMGLLTFSLVGFAYNPDIRWQTAGTLVCFGLINFFYQLSLVPYNWLLPSIKGVENSEISWLTGIGESFGNLGSVAGAMLGAGILAIPGFLTGPNASIDLLAIISSVYLVLFLADYFFMRRGMDNHAEWAVPESVSIGSAFKEYYGAAWTTLTQNKSLSWYFGAFVLYADALLTVSLYLPVYMKQRVGLSEALTAVAFALSLSTAALGAYLFAKVETILDLRTTIILSLAFWVPVLLVLGATPNRPAFWAAMVVAGFLFGVVWSASRAYLYVLAPAAHLGRAFGLYSVFQRCASILGPLLWGGIMMYSTDLETQYFRAFGAMSLMLIGAIAILWIRRSD